MGECKTFWGKHEQEHIADKYPSLLLKLLLD